MKCPRLYLCLAHFYFISIHQLHPPSVNATNAPTQSWMIWSNPYHHMTFLVHRSWPCLLFTVASVHRRQVLPKLHRLAVHRFKALTCPSPLQPVHQAKPCLDLLHLGHITLCHVSYAMSSFSSSPMYLHIPIVDATNAPTQSWMIWSTPYHHITSLIHRSWPCSLFTVVSVHRCQDLPKLHRLAVHRFKALTCPIPLQPVQRNRSSWVLSVDGNYFPFWPSTSRE